MAKKVLLNVPPPMLEKIDYIAEAKNMTRSEYIRQAVRESIEKDLNKLGNQWTIEKHIRAGQSVRGMAPPTTPGFLKSPTPVEDDEDLEQEAS